MSWGNTPEFEAAQMREEKQPMQTPLNGAITRATVELKHGDMVLLKVNLWYLILSAILRSDPPFTLGKSLEESVLTLSIEEPNWKYQLTIPQPPEFRDE
jgi:hypothetical protein